MSFWRLLIYVREHVLVRQSLLCVDAGSALQLAPAYGTDRTVKALSVSTAMAIAERLAQVRESKLCVGGPSSLAPV